MEIKIKFKFFSLKIDHKKYIFLYCLKLFDSLSDWYIPQLYLVLSASEGHGHLKVSFLNL